MSAYASVRAPPVRSGVHADPVVGTSGDRRVGPARDQRLSGALTCVAVREGYRHAGMALSILGRLVMTAIRTPGMGARRGAKVRLAPAVLPRGPLSSTTRLTLGS